MRSRYSKLRAALLVLLLAAPVSAYAVDNARTTLESDLAGDIVLDLIKTFDAATAAPAGFESFEALYLAFETERKWQAYLDAIKAANLPTDGAPLAELTAAEKKELNLKGGGVRVASAEGPAARAGLREGDVIVAIANAETASVKDVEAALGKVDKTRPINVLFRRGEWAQYAVIRAPR